MIIKAKISYPKLKYKSKVIKLEVADGMAHQEIVEYLLKNKKKIVEEHGGKINEEILSKEIAIGNVSVNLIT